MNPEQRQETSALGRLRPTSTLGWFLAAFLPLALLITGANVLVIWSREDLSAKRIETEQQAIVSLEKGILETTLANRASDTRFLADLVEMQLAGSRDKGVAMGNITLVFLSFSQDHPEYAQVRLLDALGREVVRIDRGWNQEPAIIPFGQLQDKGSRPYFRKAMELGSGGVYVSVFDLNMERGKVETPRKPTIRFSCAVIGHKGQKLGAVVLNLDGRSLLTRMRRSAFTVESDMQLYNSDGYLLLGPDPAEEWTFMFPEKAAKPLAETSPRLWKTMMGKAMGTIRCADGLYSFARAGMDLMEVEAGTHIVAEEHWIVATFTPAEAFSSEMRKVAVPMTIGALALLAGIIFFWARQRSARAEADDKIRAIGKAALDPIIMVDAQDRVTFWNPGAERVFGYTAREMAGNSLHALMLPENKLKEVRWGFAEFARTGKGPALNHILEFTARTKKGNEIQVEVSIAPLNLRGQWHAVGTVRDVTARRKAEQTTRLLAAIVETSDDAIIAEDMEGVVTAWNKGAERIYGYAEEEMLGRHISVLAPMEVLGEIPILIERIRNNEFLDHHETKRKTKDGRILDISLNLSPIKDRQGAIIGVSAIARDITEDKKAELALKESRARFQAMSSAALDAIVMVNDEGLVVFWNPAAERIFGFSESEALDQEIHDLITADLEQAEEAKQGVARFAKSGRGPALGNILEFTARRKDGSTLPVERSMAAFQLGGRWFAVASMRDITERKLHEEELTRLATTDPLTGLFNRRYFMETAHKELARAVRYNTPLSLLMLDLDKFKSVNDTHGHDVGDLVLKATSGATARILRETDVFGRLGGEEFAVLMPQTDAEAGLRVAERIRLAVQETEIDAPSGPLKVTASLGLATLGGEFPDIETLLKAADLALYQAKNNGRNRVETA